MSNSEPARSAIVYKVVASGAWAEAESRGVYTGSPDDARDGFIHLSAAHQLQGTLGKHFRGQNNLLLVAFEAASLGPALKFEASRGGDFFPHLYQPLPTALALWQRPLLTGDDGVAVVEEDWLK